MLGTGPGTGDIEMNKIAITLKELYSWYVEWGEGIQ